MPPKPQNGKNKEGELQAWEREGLHHNTRTVFPGQEVLTMKESQAWCVCPQWGRRSKSEASLGYIGRSCLKNKKGSFQKSHGVGRKRLLTGSAQERTEAY
jgi:hypothetical protein